jgi:hypothetical protein
MARYAPAAPLQPLHIFRSAAAARFSDPRGAPQRAQAVTAPCSAHASVGLEARCAPQRCFNRPPSASSNRWPQGPCPREPHDALPSPFPIGLSRLRAATAVPSAAAAGGHRVLAEPPTLRACSGRQRGRATGAAGRKMAFGRPIRLCGPRPACVSVWYTDFAQRQILVAGLGRTPIRKTVRWQASPSPPPVRHRGN